MGNEYSSREKMLAHYGLSSTAFQYRLEKMHMSLEEALTSPKKPDKSTALQCEDHLGNKFVSKAAMCDYWGIRRSVFFLRIKNGWSLEDTLTKKPQRNHTQTKTFTDHKGNVFESLDEMCTFWKMPKHQYMLNMRNNCSLEEALTTITEAKYDECVDHLGNKYTSINEMCRHYGITKTKLRSRLELGWTLQEILENPDKKHAGKKVKDHLNQEFNSINDMLNYYGISPVVYKHRLKKGHSLEETLSNKNLHKKSCEDHLGNTFETIQSLCEYWCISTSTYHHHMQHNMSIKDTLNTIPKKYTNAFMTLSPAIVLSRFIDDYCEVKIQNKSYIWSILHFKRTSRLILEHNLQIKAIDDKYFEVHIDDDAYVVTQTELGRHLKQMIEPYAKNFIA